MLNQFSLNGHTDAVAKLKTLPFIYIHIPTLKNWDKLFQVSSSRTPYNSHALTISANHEDAIPLLVAVVQGTSFAEFELENPYVAAEELFFRTYKIPSRVWQKQLFGQ